MPNAVALRKTERPLSKLLFKLGNTIVNLDLESSRRCMLFVVIVCLASCDGRRQSADFSPTHSSVAQIRPEHGAKLRLAASPEGDIAVYSRMLDSGKTEIYFENVP